MKNIKSKIKFTIISISSFFLLSSCSLLDNIWWIVCELMPESDHCFQFIAVQSSEPSACEKIKWTSFKDWGSNPPRDKCYLQIAENTWDESICNNIKWWYMSYSAEECKWSTRTKLVKTLDEELSELDKDIEYSVWYTEKEDLIKKKKELEAKLRETFNKLPEKEKSDYYQKKKDEILAEVKDDDVKQQIAHSFNKFKWQNQDDILKQIEWLKKITETEMTAKQLDENANILVDKVKSTLVDMVNEKKDTVLDDLQQKALEEVYKRSWQNMKYSLDKLKWLKETYDKWSEYYKSANEKYEKLKAAYDKMKDIQDRLWKIDKLWKEWKLDAWKVEVLKWSILLWEWLEIATSYVPVFWDTISTVTKETFWVVNKFATWRAMRTTAINKCIDDPANCDTDDISWY